MYQNKYYVPKASGTYAETLEAYGLAKILSHIFKSNNIYNPNIRIKDEGGYYSVFASILITEEMVNNTPYFDAYPYIKVKDDKTENIPSRIIDYESEKNKRDIYRKKRDEIFKIKDEKKRKILFKEMKESENTPHPDFDIFLKVRDPKNIKTYNNTLISIFKNKKSFSFILKNILLLYNNLINKEQNVRNRMKKWMKENKIREEVS